MEYLSELWLAGRNFFIKAMYSARTGKNAPAIVLYGRGLPGFASVLMLCAGSPDTADAKQIKGAHHFRLHSNAGNPIPRLRLYEPVINRHRYSCTWWLHEGDSKIYHRIT